MDNSQKTYWVKTSIQGLYERRTSGLPKTVRGVFYYRYSLNGKQTFRSLDTDVYEHAKIKHAARNVTVEKDRQRGASGGGDFKTLGALLAEVEKRFAEDPTENANTKTHHAYTIARLKKHWQQGSFDTFLVRNCTSDVIAKLRDYLLNKACWRRGQGRGHREYVGLKSPVVNQTLWMLRVMLDVAVEKSVITENPFAVPTVLRDSLYAKGGKQGPDGPKGGGSIRNIPSRPDMMRIVNQLRRVPDDGRTDMLPFRQACANQIADHVELMAFSGMRKSEAVKSVIGDDQGTKFLIRGTKSAKSWRTIPVNPALRSVLDRIKSRRIGSSTALLTVKSPRNPLIRACEELGLPRMRVHDLRHFFASACISSGVPITTVSEWLGHSDGGALCMKTYSHLLEDHSQAAAQKVDFSGALQAVG